MHKCIILSYDIILFKRHILHHNIEAQMHKCIILSYLPDLTWWCIQFNQIFILEICLITTKKNRNIEISSNYKLVI